MQGASSPILLVYDEAYPLKRILIALRGFSSDDYMLDWLIPLICHTKATVTLMPIYDLLTITAEGYGEFVSSVLVALGHHSSNVRCPVLVMKPICR